MCSFLGLFVDDKISISNQPLWGVLAHNLALTQMQWDLGILDVSTHCCIPLIRKSREGKLKKGRKVKLAQSSYHHSAPQQPQMFMLTLDVVHTSPLRYRPGTPLAWDSNEEMATRGSVLSRTHTEDS